MNQKSKIIPIILIFITTLFLILGVVWLVLIMLAVIGFYLVLKTKNPTLQKIFHSKWFSVPISVMMIFSVAIFFRLFVVEVYEIPSGSMENTLIPGDKIIVNKLIIGPQTPKSPFDIPWVNLFFYMNKQARAHIDSTWWEPNRLKGWSEIKHNDVLVFKNEPLAPDFFIKRCVALPGDELQIINSDILINGSYSSTNKLPGIKKTWEVSVNNMQNFDALIDSLQLIGFNQDYTSGEAKRTLILTQREVEQLKQSLLVDSINVVVQQPNKDAWLSPYGKRAFWSLDNYGPIRIPFKGWKIDLNDTTVMLYYETILTWERKKIETINNHFYINGKEVSDYTFQYNYYVFIGDNRNNSLDSRMWGFLPEPKIVGKATTILWSNYEGEMKWGRTLKSIQ